jgi:CubicO group peptidase (beta-lactamase class C family)
MKMGSAFVALVLFAASTTFVRAADAVFPGATWEKTTPAEIGWSTQKLQQAHEFFQTLPSSSVIVIDRGRLVLEWGDLAKRIKLSSVRKSLLSALYGIYVRAGSIGLDKTLDQLGIDDEPPLTPEEKQATLRTVIQARSGVYHSYVGGTPDMRDRLPLRGSHPPGTFWYYNNWDFNVLGAIFEQQTKKKIAEAFRDDIATPIGMEDFRLEDMYYDHSTDSLYPAYHFRLSARDMARFGYLFLHEGNWNGRQIIPKEWVEESTRSYSDAGDGRGYGYLWWVNLFSVPVASYSAFGALGKYIVVIPEKEIVVAFANHIGYPDAAELHAMSDAELRRLPNVSPAQMSRLLNLIIEAQARR